MKRMNMRKLAATFGASALIVTGLVAITPSAHAADPVCVTSTKTGVQTCQGKLTNGASYLMMVPAAFNGTFYYWNHGFRASYPYPGYSVPTGVQEITPYNPSTGKDITKEMLYAGYGLASYDRSSTGLHGWNSADSVEMLKNLIDIAKAKFPTTTKNIIYGSSAAGAILTPFVEKYPTYADAVGIMAGLTPPAANEIKSLCDAFYIMSVFFDPTIKGCAAMGAKGVAGHMAALNELGKVVTLLKGWSTDYGAKPLAYPAAITPYGIPQRSALLLSGLMIGLPTKSSHMDGISTSTLVPEQSINATIAILENYGEAIATGALAGQAISEITGPGFYDNTKTDWAALLSDEDAARFNLGLSGGDAITAMIGVLSAAPRVTGDPAAMAKLATLDHVDFSTTKPVVLLSNEADRLVFAGNTSYYVDKAQAVYDQRLADYQSGKSKVKPVWNTLAMYAMTPVTYTKFLASGAPDLSAKTAAVSGVGHQNFTVNQMMAWVRVLAQSAKYGHLPTDNYVMANLKRDPNLNLDPMYRPNDLKYTA
jgi:hypothetical protein